MAKAKGKEWGSKGYRQRGVKEKVRVVLAPITWSYAASKGDTD